MNLHRVGNRTFQQSQGGWYEDFFPGMIIRHWPGRTITEVDNIWLTLLLMNQHPLHIDKAYAASTNFGKTVVNSSITLALVGGLTVQTTSANAIANLGWESVRLHEPVFVGDTLYASTEVLSCRKSRSHPDQGIVRVHTQGTKSTGEVVISFERSFLVSSRGARAPIEGAVMQDLKMEHFEVEIDRSTWLRLRPDMSEPLSGLHGDDAREMMRLAIAMGGGGIFAHCVMGKLLKHIRDISDDMLLDKKYPSDLEIEDFIQPVAAANGEVVTMEREIARIHDRKGPYASMSEHELEQRLAGLLASRGIKITFIN